MGCPGPLPPETTRGTTPISGLHFRNSDPTVPGTTNISCYGEWVPHLLHKLVYKKCKFLYFCKIYFISILNLTQSRNHFSSGSPRFPALCCSPGGLLQFRRAGVRGFWPLALSLIRGLVPDFTSASLRGFHSPGPFSVAHCCSGPQKPVWLLFLLAVPFCAAHGHSRFSPALSRYPELLDF